MKRMTRLLWADQNQHPGDRQRMFEVVARYQPIHSVLYPGSFVDVAASFVFDDVTYVDNDDRAAVFFADVDGVAEIIAGHRTGTGARWRFLPLDYRSPLPLPEASVDLLVSLYAGFVSEHCARYVKADGLLLVNSSHGDAAMASIDDGFEFVAAVERASGAYRLQTQSLDRFLVPRRPTTITKESLRALGRGVEYVTPAAAYLFRRL